MKIRVFILSFMFIFINIVLSISDITDSLSTNVKMGIRAKAMGNSFIAISDNADAIFFNPAGLPKMKNKEFCFITTNLFPLDIGSITNQVFSYAQYDEGYGAYGIAFNKLECDLDPEKYTYNTWIISYGKKAGEFFYIGGDVKILKIQSDFEYQKDKKFEGKGNIFGLGIIYSLSPSLSFGLKIDDLQNTIKYTSGLKENKPLEFQTGFAYNLKDICTLALDTNIDNNFSPKNINLGLEYEYNIKNSEKVFQLKKVLFRSGVSKLLYGNEKLTGSGGLSIRWKTFEVNYAFVIDDFKLSNTHWFSVSFYVKD
ncbi:MAG: hypothetical protein ABIB46_01560 [bacterium]